MIQKPFIIDGHLDLAWNALHFGRDYRYPVATTRERELGGSVVARTGTATLGLPELRAAGVALIFATLYAPPAHATMSDKVGYQDAEAAHAQYLEQLDLYRRWADEQPDDFSLITARDELEALLAVYHDSEQAPLGLMVLMEGADGIREPEEVEWWLERGVRAIGLSWSATRYAGGTAAPGPLTAEGRALLEQMGRHGAILDLSHLSDEGVDEALERYDGPLMASHAAPRTLLPQSTVPERHLSDHALHGIAERGGVIGLVLGSGFLLDGWHFHRDRSQVTLDHVANAIDCLSDLLGSVAHIALGSDLDGGFGLESIPTGLESVADLPRIGDVLADRGYTDEQIHAIFGLNWLRFLRHALPETSDR